MVLHSIPFPTCPEGGKHMLDKGAVRVKIMGKLYESEVHLNETGQRVDEKRKLRVW